MSQSFYKEDPDSFHILCYKASGKTDCLYGIGPVCGLPIVNVVSLK
jgi:hypothetical protein